jgi:hypothetical protein
MKASVDGAGLICRAPHPYCLSLEVTAVVHEWFLIAKVRSKRGLFLKLRMTSVSTLFQMKWSN